MNKIENAVLKTASALGFKYLLEPTIVVGGQKVRQIVACKDFGNIKRGDLGGYVSTAKNLSHKGTCWIYDSARVLEDARIVDDAEVKDFAVVEGTTLVEGYAIIKDTSYVSGNSRIKGGSFVSGRAKVYNSLIFDECVVSIFVNNGIQHKCK